MYRYIYLYVCIYMYIYICIHTYVHTYFCIFWRLYRSYGKFDLHLARLSSLRQIVLGFVQGSTFVFLYEYPGPYPAR